jgi:glucose/arabinose dehydrogenase
VADADGSTESIRVRPADGRRGASSRTTLRLPDGTDAAAIAFARGMQMPALEGDLFAASRQGRHLLRLHIDRRDPGRVVASERLFPDVAGPFTEVVPGPDGALYVGTETAILRICPG